MINIQNYEGFLILVRIHLFIFSSLEIINLVTISLDKYYTKPDFSKHYKFIKQKIHHLFKGQLISNLIITNLPTYILVLENLDFTNYFKPNSDIQLNSM
jgi:hypothetical protein